MLHRVFCESLQSDNVVIDDAEAHHLLHVLRLKTGHCISLFDGSGTEADATITHSSRREVFCTVTHRRQTPKAAFVRLTVIAAPPKAERLKWMVEKLTEVGVERLILLESERTVVTPGESRVDRLRSSVISACKQCRRNVLMQISPLQSLASVLEDVTSGRLVGELRIAHPSPLSFRVPSCATTHSGERLLLIGPEGGFTEAEVESAINAGAVLMSWPSTILRVETAAIVFASQLLADQRESAIF